MSVIENLKIIEKISKLIWVFEILEILMLIKKLRLATKFHLSSRIFELFIGIISLSLKLAFMMQLNI